MADTQLIEVEGPAQGKQEYRRPGGGELERQKPVDKEKRDAGDNQAEKGR